MEQVKCLGWLNYFAPKDEMSVADFYRDVLGLPLIRSFRAGDHPVDFYWAGEAITYEIIFEGLKGPAEAYESDPDTAPMVGIYRVHRLSDVVAALAAKGAKVSPIREIEGGLEAFVTDPRGYLTGLREVVANSTAAADVEARRRWRRGEAFNPGCDRLPDGWQDLGWIVRRVKDLPAMGRYYSEVLGLAVVGRRDGRIQLDLGDGAVLELAPGGQIVDLPNNRAELSHVIILRVHQINAMKARLVAGGAAVVHDLIQWDRGELCYVADPEGNLIGIEEKYHPSRYVKTSPIPAFPEDIEAERRWIEAKAAS